MKVVTFDSGGSPESALISSGNIVDLDNYLDVIIYQSHLDKNVNIAQDFEIS